jgi:hypothetical protein
MRPELPDHLVPVADAAAEPPTRSGRGEQHAVNARALTRPAEPAAPGPGGGAGPAAPSPGMAGFSARSAGVTEPFTVICERGPQRPPLPRPGAAAGLVTCLRTHHRACRRSRRCSASSRLTGTTSLVTGLGPNADHKAWSALAVAGRAPTRRSAGFRDRGRLPVEAHRSGESAHAFQDGGRPGHA